MTKPPEPSTKAFVIYTVILMTMIYAIGEYFQLEMAATLVMAGFAGWYARNIIWFWNSKIVPGVLNAINEWAKK